MPSELFNSFGNGAAQASPRQSALNLLKQRGITVPESMANNPNAIIQHLMQTGAVPHGRLSMAQQVLSRMFRR